MKRLFFILAIIISLAITIPAVAGSPYVSLKGSFAKTDISNIKFTDSDDAYYNPVSNRDNSDSITSPGIAIGYDFGETRIEFEFFNRATAKFNTTTDAIVCGFLHNNILDIQSDIKTKTFFINSYTDFEINKSFELYTGMGIGLARHKSNITGVLAPGWFWTNTGTNTQSDSDSNTEFAWNVQFGSVYKINKNIAFDLGLRYANLGKADMTDVFKDVKVKSKEVVLSVRYTF